MTHLPPGWAETTVGEMCKVEYGKGLSAKERHSSGSVPVIGSAGITGWHDTPYVTDPCIVIGRKGNAGEAHLSIEPCWPIDTTYFLRVPSNANPTFLWRQLSQLDLGRLDSSTAIPSLRRPDLEAARLVLPPLAEQDRIVEAVEERFTRLDAAEASLRRATANIARLRGSTIDDLFRYSDWPWTTLGEIAEIKGGVTKDAKLQSDPRYEEVPYLRVANVQRGYLDLAEVTTIRVSPEKAEALRLEPGDVLFNEGGDRDKLGRGWVWEGQVPNCIHQNHVFRARLEADFEPKFVSLHGNRFGQRWFEDNGRQTTNLASINMRTLKAFPVPAPSREIQAAVVEEVEQRLGSIARLAIEADHVLRRSRQLRRSILQRAFSGELVPQDPGDPPATVLLDEITSTVPAGVGRGRNAPKKETVG